ncbi:MAG TPA: DUF2269 family protein [Methylomirabilota bacterium]|jgi:uncharacterized membrane protein|nr:DUF2269 family protein [Methylomirabilota bacterium]
MPELIPWFLVLHVLGAIIAFGPSFSFPIIGAMGAADRAHANFAVRVSHAISTKRQVPVALTMPVTGIGLIWSAGIDPFSRDSRWLALGIILYVILFTYAVAVQLPVTNRIIEMTSSPPPDAPAGSAPSGPPPALAALITKVQRGGMFLTAMVVVIVFLMVVKPNLGF